MMKRKDEGNKDIKKTTSRKAAGKAEKSSGGGSGISRFMMISSLLMAVVLISGLSSLAWLQFARQQAVTDSLMARQMAGQQVTLLNEHIAYAKKMLTDIAVSDFATQPDGALSSQERGRLITQMLPNAQLHILSADINQLPEELSFSAREAAQQAREITEPVVTIVPNTPPLMLIAQKMPNGNVALLTWKMARLEALLRTEDTANAYIKVSRGSADILSVGRPSNGESVTLNASGDMVVTVTLPPGASDPSLLILFAAVSVACVLLALVVLVGTLRTISQGLQKDAALLALLNKDLAGNPQASAKGDFTFSVLELTTKSLRALAAKRLSSAMKAPTGGARRSALELVVEDEDSGLLVVDEQGGSSSGGVALPAEIFRAYDIRGVVDQNLTAEFVELIGRALGTEAMQVGQKSIAVARDGRLSGESLQAALTQGITSTGCNVIDIGMAPTPVLYYATKVLDTQSGVCITGSHNPANENGLKIVLNGETLHGERITALRDRIEKNEFLNGTGNVLQKDLSAQYVDEIVGDIVLARPMKVVVDSANGVTGKMAPELLRQLGCEVIELFTEIDGNFPNHSPDTSNPDNYEALRAAVAEHNAEVGIAFDGDGDRLGVLTGRGEIIWADRLMMLFAQDLLTRSPGADIIFDVKCSRELPRLISKDGGRPLMWKTGHSLIKAKLKETGAPLAGEMSGHIFFADRWHGFDDGMYGAGRLLEILSLEGDDATALFDNLKAGVSTPEISIKVSDQIKFSFINKLIKQADAFVGGAAVTIDGLRVDYDDGWGLIRASNTGPKLVARFEGVDDAALARIQGEFKQQLLAINPQLTLPF
jgi:phosphomannomutase / phosphoglucomutase